MRELRWNEYSRFWIDFTLCLGIDTGPSMSFMWWCPLIRIIFVSIVFVILKLLHFYINVSHFTYPFFLLLLVFVVLCLFVFLLMQKLKMCDVSLFRNQKEKKCLSISIDCSGRLLGFVVVVFCYPPNNRVFCVCVS